jgi:hypothetical protein
VAVCRNEAAVAARAGAWANRQARMGRLLAAGRRGFAVQRVPAARSGAIGQSSSAADAGGA